jgi:hypothetical protein
MATKLITFKTTQTIIGEISTTSQDILDKKIRVSYPVQIIIQPTQQGPMMGFVPFLEFCEEFKQGILFNEDDILTTTTPVVELINKYNEVFGSGIQIAKVTDLPRK